MYDFISIIDRKGKDALAVDVIPVEGAEIEEGFSRIPMWVADMNFATAPSITETIIDRTKHPAFGYYIPRKEYYDAIMSWQKERNHVEIKDADCIGYENGVLGGVSSALSAFCSRGDKVLLHSPVYIGFRNVLENNGYQAIYSPLKKDEEGIWRMDYIDMEEKIRKHKIRTAIFCSPHNPCGRVWERWELNQLMELYKRYDINVISDEIWSDLTLTGYQHIPTQSVSEDARMRTVALYAPSKTFNLAGLIGSYHVIYNEKIRDRVRKEASLTHYNSMNVLSMHALMGAYTPKGAVWLDELKAVLTENVNYAYDFIRDNFKGISLSRPQGTYMLFLDCSDWCKSHDVSLDELLKAGIRYGVIWQDGRPFQGDHCIRMNLALPTSLVQEAFDRLKRYVF